MTTPSSPTPVETRYPASRDPDAKAGHVCTACGVEHVLAVPCCGACATARPLSPAPTPPPAAGLDPARLAEQAATLAARCFAEHGQDATLYNLAAEVRDGVRALLAALDAARRERDEWRADAQSLDVGLTNAQGELERAQHERDAIQAEASSYANRLTARALEAEAALAAERERDEARHHLEAARRYSAANLEEMLDWKQRAESAERERDEVRRRILADDERRKLTGDALQADADRAEAEAALAAERHAHEAAVALAEAAVAYDDAETLDLGAYQACWARYRAALAAYRAARPATPEGR